MTVASQTARSRASGRGLVDQFADRLQVRARRTPIREALRKPQASGAVELVSRRRALVRGQTAREINQGCLVSAEFEGLAAVRAAGWIRDEQLERLRGAEKLLSAAVYEFVALTERIRLAGELVVEWFERRAGEGEQ